MVSCNNEEDIYKRVREYLEKEYPDRKFTVIDYEKRSETSGRYEINARCTDDGDGTNFKIYIYSSITVTDSYSVERANHMMEDIIATEIGEELFKKIKYVNWYDIYADKSSGYGFRKVPVKETVSFSDLETIEEIKIDESVEMADIGGVIYDFMYALCNDTASACDISEAEFVFKSGRYTYRFKTSSEAILELGRDGTIYYIIKNITSQSSTFKDVEFEYFSADEIEEAELEKEQKTRKK
jgi:hypothetical protein